MISLMALHLVAIAAYAALYRYFARLAKIEKLALTDRVEKTLRNIRDEAHRLAQRFADEIVSGISWAEAVRRLRDERLELLKRLPFYKSTDPLWTNEDLARACDARLTREVAKIHTRCSRQLIQGTGVLAAVTVVLSLGIWAAGRTDIVNENSLETPSTLAGSSFDQSTSSSGHAGVSPQSLFQGQTANKLTN